MSVTDVHVLLLLFELRISYRLSSRFNISSAELGDLDNWNQAVVGITIIANDRQYLDGQASHIEKTILEVKDIELITVSKEWL